ncbi:SLC44A1 [Cordylochernes scorpioides]|uniref:Choline transporter-like protein n=1 Tax=Cordylochernes scorpioides TaxID=51811 RepID=A0ABY6L5J6_9ARAC|nr:SLC44A1 [Cordylochernes scorpioides]
MTSPNQRNYAQLGGSKGPPAPLVAKFYRPPPVGAGDGGLLPLLLWGRSQGPRPGLGDPSRLVWGYDGLGDVCGRRNPELSGVQGSGQDHRDRPATWLRRCVYGGIMAPVHSALRAGGAFLDEAAGDVAMTWKDICYLLLAALGMTGVLMLVLRFLAGVIIWSLLGFISLATLAVTAYLWTRWSKERVDDRKYWLGLAILSTVATAIILLVILVMRKRIYLVAALFREAGKALSAMPSLFLMPLWTFCSVVGFGFVWLLGFLYLSTAARPRQDPESGAVDFPLDSFFETARWLHLFLLAWMTQFILSCQHVVIAGAVCGWFFTRSVPEDVSTWEDVDVLVYIQR